MKKLPLTRGLLAIVDDDVYKWASIEHWHANFPEKNGKPYARNGSGVYLHKKILGLPAVSQGDHRDGNTLDCRRKNLRIATPAQNAQGFKKKRDGLTSRFRGVRWNKLRRSWSAQITFKYKAMHLGVFASEVAAAFAYDEAAKRHFKEFAHLNFP